MNGDPARPPSGRPGARRVKIGSLAFGLGGLAPLITGIVGLHGYLTKGYFVAKTGEIVSGATAWIWSGLFVLAGLGMMAFAVWQYRRHTRPRV